MSEKRKEKKEGFSWKEVWLLNKRAILLWLREYPALFLSTSLHSVIAALLPCLTLYFSAKLLDELAGARRPEVLTRWVVILLGADAGAYLLKALVKRWKEALAGTMYYHGEARFSRKLLSMDFCAADDVSTHNLLSQIRQREGWTGQGLGKIYWQFESLVQELFRMLGAAVLTISLFRLPVPKEAGWLTCLNNPFFILLLAAVMVGVAVLSPWLFTLAEMRIMNHDEEMRLGNRYYFFCMDLFREEKRALDMRIYRQDIYGLKHVRAVADTRNGVSAGWARDARGWMGFLYALSAAASRVFVVVVYLFVCLKAWGGAFGVGSVTRYIGAITAFSTGFAGVLKVIGDARINSDTLKSTFAFLDIPNEMYQGSLTVEKRSDRKYEVEFRNVSFKYPHMEEYALKNISLKFQVGERLAVVGRNGSGKTTFIKLLCRLYDPTEGAILLNGIDIRKYNYREYLNVFSVVFQDFQLLAMSLGENVAAGSSYDREEVMRCLEKAGLSRWVHEQPEGPDTILYKDLDARGVKISGGEAQKVAIARSLYHNAPFIILDEPTAALDPEAEYEIYTRFNEIVGDRTAVFISHRLSSCRFCDEIIVFHEGELVQQGSHQALLADAGGKYSQLWNAQAQYYVEG